MTLIGRAYLKLGPGEDPVVKHSKDAFRQFNDHICRLVVLPQHSIKAALLKAAETIVEQQVLILLTIRKTDNPVDL